MASIRVLIVEDETIVAEDLRGSLVDLGYEVTGTAISGEQAVQLAEETRPDVVLMDIMLQGETASLFAGNALTLGPNVGWVVRQRRPNTCRQSVERVGSAPGFSAGVDPTYG